MASPAVTYTFSNSTTADATQVNQNYTDLINGATDGTKDYSINALTVAGTATLNGDVNIGNASADTLIVTASLGSTVPIKTTYLYDIGSATLGLKRVYFGSNDSAARSVAVQGGVVTSSYTLSLPVAAPSANNQIVKCSTAGVMAFENRMTLNVVAKTTTYTATTDDDVITCGTASGWTLSLPAAATSTGKVLFIKKTSSDTNALTIDGNASETIDGQTTRKLIHQFERMTIVCDGSGWQILEHASMSTTSSQYWRSCSTFINGSATTPTFSSNGPEFSSITRNGVGDYTINFVSGTFGSSALIVTGTLHSANGYVRTVSFGTDNVRIQTVDTAGAAAEDSYNLHVMGPRS